MRSDGVLLWKWTGEEATAGGDAELVSLWERLPGPLWEPEEHGRSYLDWWRHEDLPASVVKGRGMSGRRFVAVRVRVQEGDGCGFEPGVFVAHERYQAGRGGSFWVCAGTTYGAGRNGHVVVELVRRLLAGYPCECDGKGGYLIVPDGVVPVELGAAAVGDRWWEGVTADVAVRRQLCERRLLMPLTVFLSLLQVALGRPVMNFELAKLEGLAAELEVKGILALGDSDEAVDRLNDVVDDALLEGRFLFVREFLGLVRASISSVAEVVIISLLMLTRLCREVGAARFALLRVARVEIARRSGDEYAASVLSEIGDEG